MKRYLQRFFHRHVFINDLLIRDVDKLQSRQHVLPEHTFRQRGSEFEVSEISLAEILPAFRVQRSEGFSR